MPATREKTRTRKPKWKRRPDHRPVEIAEAALDIFSEQGFDATTMDDIALRSGVSKGTIYLYYPSKEDLLIACVEHRIRENQMKVLPLIQLATSNLESRLTPDRVREILTQAVNKILDLLSGAETQKVTKVVMSERSRVARLREKQAELGMHAIKSLAAFLKRAHSDGAIDCPNPDAIAKALFGINFTVVIMSEILNLGKLGEVKPRDRKAVLEFTFRGLGLSMEDQI